MIQRGRIFILTFILLSIPVLTSSSNFMLINTCVCPCIGYNLTFQCTTTGSGNTIWKGSAFDCVDQNQEIVLQHTLFSSHGGISQKCGNFTGRSLSVENNHYTSQISVPFSLGLIGQSIQCIHDNTGDAVVVGNSTISVTAGPGPSPPSNITLVKIRSDPVSELTFSWTRIALDCIDTQYNIISDCGQCPTTTKFTTVICHGVDIPVDGRVCSFMIKTIVCEHISSDFQHLYLNLKVPDSPLNVDVVPIYSAETRQFLGLRSTFIVLRDFNITDRITTPVISYTISYTDVTTGSICSSATILHSSCVMSNSYCIHVYDVLSSPCSHSVPLNITVSATNVFGESPSSQPIVVFDLNDTFVNVSVDELASAVTCTFLNEKQSGVVKTCSITYKAYNDTKVQCELEALLQPAWHEIKSAESLSNTVTIGLPYLRNHGILYCFIVIANNGTHTALVQGRLSQDFTDHSEISFRLPFIILMTLMVYILFVIIMVIPITFIVRTFRERRKVTIPIVESVTTQVVEYEEIAPNMNNNPAYDTICN